MQRIPTGLLVAADLVFPVFPLFALLFALLFAGSTVSAQLPTDISLVSPLPHPSFPEPDYWNPIELTQDGWVLMYKTSDPVLGRPTELWKPFVGTVPLHSVTQGLDLWLVDSAVDDPACRPGYVYVCGMLGRAHAQSLQGIPHPDDLLGFVYEVDMTTGQIRSLIEEGIRILRFEPSDGSYYRISPNPGATPPWDNRLIGVPAAPLPRNWSLIGGKGSRFGWCCLASNSVTGARAAWRFSRATGTWVQLPIPNCDEVVDISEDGLVVVREYLSPGYAAYHSIAADGSIRNYASPDISYFEGANSHGLVLYRTQVFEHATGFETAFPGPLNMIDINDTGAVVGTEGYYQLSPATALLDCSRDTVAPTLSCPGSVEALDSKSGSPGEIVFFTMTALDDTDPTPSVLCVPPSGSFFPRGTTIVTCTATDASGNQSVCLFPVVVMPTIR